MRDLFVRKLHKMISNDPKVILLTADLGFGAFECFEPFRDKQYFNVGISEQLMAINCSLIPTLKYCLSRKGSKHSKAPNPRSAVSNITLGSLDIIL